MKVLEKNTARQVITMDVGEQKSVWLAGNSSSFETREFKHMVKTDNAQFVPWGLMKEPCQIMPTLVSKHKGFFFCF